LIFDLLLVDGTREAKRPLLCNAIAKTQVNNVSSLHGMTVANVNVVKLLKGWSKHHENTDWI
jgi:hypothetical protein